MIVQFFGLSTPFNQLGAQCIQVRSSAMISDLVSCGELFVAFDTALLLIFQSGRHESCVRVTTSQLLLITVLSALF